MAKAYPKAFEVLAQRRWEFASFWLAGWTILLVVLLSAAPTGEQIRLRTIGSAFDPATASVAVRTQKQKIDSRQLVSSRTGEDIEGAKLPPLQAFSLTGGLPQPVTFAGVHVPARASFSVPPDRPLARPQAARAPPEA